MPSVSFCLFAHPIQLLLSIYLSDPPRAGKREEAPGMDIFEDASRLCHCTLHVIQPGVEKRLVSHV